MYLLAFIAGFWITFIFRIFETVPVDIHDYLVLGIEATAVGILGIIIYALIDISIEEE